MNCPVVEEIKDSCLWDVFMCLYVWERVLEFMGNMDLSLSGWSRESKVQDQKHLAKHVQLQDCVAVSTETRVTRQNSYEEQLKMHLAQG